jgi:hypothetical protein
MAIEDRTSPIDRPTARPTIGAPMLIDRLMPTYHAMRVEHRIIPGDIATVYAATRRADFIRTWRESATVRLLFAARDVAERAISLIARREHRQPPPPDSLRLADMPTHGDWVLLGEDPPHELAFGVIGHFWAGETVWAKIDGADFETFAEPGFGKIACNFSLRSYGPDRTLVTYECRTIATDETWPPRVHALLASTGAVHRPGHALTATGNRGRDRRPLDRAGARTCTGWGTGGNQEKRGNRATRRRSLSPVGRPQSRRALRRHSTPAAHAGSVLPAAESSHAGVRLSRC